jgi:hypothetical protein
MDSEHVECRDSVFAMPHELLLNGNFNGTRVVFQFEVANADNERRIDEAATLDVPLAFGCRHSHSRH